MLGWTQSHLADAAVLGLRTVQTAERGGAIAAESALGICATLGVPYVEAFLRSPEVILQQLTLRGLAPPPPPTPWIGRDGDLAVMRRALEGGRCVVLGPDGIGKSALARRLAAEGAAYPRGVAWVSAASLGVPELMQRLQRELADALGFSDQLPVPLLVPPESWTRAFVSRLWSAKRLVILDDVMDPAVVDLLQPDRATGATLVTTSDPVVAEALGGATLSMAPWTEQETSDYLLARRSLTLSAAPDRRRLLDAIAGLPARAAAAADALERSGSLEPVIAHLQSGDGAMVQPLSIRAWRLLQGLGQVRGTMVSVEWAAILSGEAPAIAEAATEELVQLGLARWHSDRSRLQLDDRARMLATRSATPPSLHEAAREMTGRLSALPVRESFRQIVADFAVWREVLDRLDGDDAFPGLLLSLSPLFRFSTVPEAVGWLTAAAAQVRDVPGDFARVAAMLAWQRMLTDYTGAEASRWFEAAEQAARGSGELSREVSLALWSTVTARADVPPRELLDRREVILKRARGGPPTAQLMALAGLGVAAMGARPERALGAFEEASALVPALTSDISPLASGVLTINRALASGAVPDDELQRALDTLRPRFLHDKLTLYMLDVLAGQLGLPPDGGAPTASEILLGVAPHQARYCMNQLLELALALQPSTRPNSRTLTIDGADFTLVAAIDAPPFSAVPGIVLELPLPVAPIGQLLDGEGLRHAMRFVSAAGGRDHPVWQALMALERHMDD